MNVKTILPALSILAALAAPTAADAETICVGDLGAVCQDVKPASAAGLTAALDDAEAQAGADTIRIAPGTYSGSFVYAKDEEVDIVGSGATETVIAGNSASPALWVSGNGSATTVSALGVRMSTTALTVGLRLREATANGVRVTNASDATIGYGVELVAGGAFRNGTIELGAAFGITTNGQDGPRAVSDSTIDAKLGVQIHSDVATLERLTIRARRAGVSNSGTTTLSNSLIVLRGTQDTVDYGLHQIGGGSLTADHTTVHVTSADAEYGAIAANGGPGSSNLVLTSSIVSGTPQRTAIARSANGAGPSNVSAGYSNFATPADAYVGPGEGPGAFTEAPAGSNTHQASPGYIDPTSTLASPGTDFRLRHDSPLIDVGAVGAGPATDLNGAPRLVDGDGNGAARRDMGAYEYQRQAPVAAIAAPQQTAFQTGLPVPFDATGSIDPDGDPISYSWSFGDGASASGKTANHAYAAAGTPTATLTVTDATGLSATATRPLTITTAPAGGGGNGGQGGGSQGGGSQAGGAGAGANAAPRLTAAALTRKRFATSGRRAGTRLSFRLSRAARVTLTLQRRARTGRFGRAKVARTLTAKPGANKLAFKRKLGKLTLKPGTYRLTLRATADGRKSTPVKLSFTVIR